MLRIIFSIFNPIKKCFAPILVTCCDAQQQACETLCIKQLMLNILQLHLLIYIFFETCFIFYAFLCLNINSQMHTQKNKNNKKTKNVKN